MTPFLMRAGGLPQEAADLQSDIHITKGEAGRYWDQDEYVVARVRGMEARMWQIIAEHLERCMHERDDFLVEHDLWAKFLQWLKNKDLAEADRPTGVLES